MIKTSKHVVPSYRGGWAVRSAGSVKASKKFETQAEAVKYGQSIARKAQTELYIHRKDGTIKDKRNYG